MSMGHSAPVNSAPDAKGKEKMHALVQLLPEEALYLIERGSMFCRKASDVQYPLTPDVFEQAIPMTLQEAYAEMIGKEDITLDRYLVSTPYLMSYILPLSVENGCKVFSYLKRLGYIVTRARPPSEFYPKAQKFPILRRIRATPWLSRFLRFVSRPFRSIFSSTLDWWKPLPLTGFFRRFTTYCKLFVTGYTP